MTTKLGDKGDDVKALQMALRALGYLYSSDVDGIFGKRTEASVRAFQRDRGLKVDGVAGPVTLNELLVTSTPVVATLEINGLVMPARRCWPMRMLADGRRPIITSRHAIHNDSRSKHWGADLLYRYDPRKDPPTKIGDSGRTRDYWIPEGTFAIAQADGEIEIAGNSKSGYRCWVRHAGGLWTGGFHFTHLAVKAGDAVELGQDLAIVGDNPSDTDPDHLHSELYRGPLVLATYPRGTLDPEIFWRGAQVLPAK